MPEDNILVAVHRDDARELLLDRGWTNDNVTNDNVNWYAPGRIGYGWSLSGALHIALADEAKQLREQAKT